MLLNNLTKLVLFCCLSSVVFLTTVSSAQEEQNDLILLVQSDKQIYKLGEVIDIRIVLKNKSIDTLSLYHQGIKEGTWHDLGLIATVTKPDSQEVVIKHEVNYSMVPIPAKEDFRTIEPEGDLVIPMKFINFDNDNFSKGNLWSASIRISEQESANIASDSLKNKYGIKGEIYYISGKYDYLATKEILKDVFNIEGQYILAFEYSNNTNYYMTSDENSEYMVGVEVPSAWTGTLTKTIMIEIVK